MSKNAKNIQSDAQERWEHDPFSQLFYQRSQWESDPQARRYSHQLLRAKDERNGLGFDAVLCVEGQPTVYFKTVDAKDPATERDWHRAIWNQGAATLLVVDDRSEVRIYSALAKPESVVVSGLSDQRLVTTLKWAADALELRAFVRSVETGEFYRRHENKFRSERPVDQYLLENLRAARDLLCDPSQQDALDREVAHAFLGRALFTCYLLERGIVGKSQLEAVGAPVERTLWQVLDKLDEKQSHRDSCDILFDLFKLLHDEFNGSMFAGRFAAERRSLRVRHLDVLRQFLRGDDLKAKQPSLGFGIYDFRFIPIELISSIYESFLAAEESGPDEDEEFQTDYTKTVRRQSGAYYTPPRLAELIVDIATQDWNSFLDKRCLDPSCGSGVFLVILFQRMAEEWARKHPQASNVERALTLRRFLTENLCGVDRNETACLVACFSLYLAFMDQFDPPDIWELRDELVRQYRSRKGRREDKVLPPLMPEPDELAAGAKTVIHSKNFFAAELDNLGPFDLIVGNPPWFGRQQAADAEMDAWLKSKRNPFLEGGYNAAAKSQFHPLDGSVIPFLWKAPCHAMDETKKSVGQVCLLLPSTVLFGNKTNNFQATWFARFRVGAVWQLADLRYFLFRGAAAAGGDRTSSAVPWPRRPATILKYSPCRPTEGYEFSYIVPKANRFDPRQAQICVLPEDEKSLSQDEVIAEGRRKEATILWKKHFWGTSRDVRFIDRLLRMPKLDDHAGRPGTKGKRWVKGAGFQRETKSTTKPAKAIWKPKDWYLDATRQLPGLILLERDCEKIGHRFDDVHRVRHAAIFQPPLVIFNKGAGKFVLSKFPVYFRDAFQSVAGPKKDEDLLLLLTAVLQSDLAQYFFFHTTGNIGIERDIGRIAEFLRMPFPLPENARKPDLARDIARQAATALKELKAKLESPLLRDSPFFDGERERLIVETKRQLAPLILDYYELNGRERVLLEDTVKVYLESATPTAIWSDVPTLRDSTPEQRKIYADYFCRTINTWARGSSDKIQTVGRICRTSGLCLLTVTRTKQPKAYAEIPIDAEFARTLQRIGEAAQEKYPGIAYLRGFFLVESDAVHLLKPLAYRHWTKTAALNDADEVMGELMLLEESR